MSNFFSIPLVIRWRELLKSCPACSSWCTEVFLETGKCRGRGETAQEPAALVEDNEKPWALPEQWQPPPVPVKISLGSPSDWSRHTEQGASARAWRGRSRGNGVFSLPDQEVSAITVGACLTVKTGVSAEKAPEVSNASTQTVLVRKEASVQMVSN